MKENWFYLSQPPAPAFLCVDFLVTIEHFMAYAWNSYILFCLLCFLAARNKTKCFPGNINNNNLQLEGSSGTFESPFYPSKYPKSINCTWVITVPYGKLVKLSFSAFDVEWSSSCDEDYVQIYDGWSSASEVKTKLCGASLPSDVSSTSRYLRVQFRSDEDNHGNCSGFKAQFEQVHKASKSTLHTAWPFVVTNIINQLNKV